ncbi:MAG: hypothetical protein ACJAW1_003756 [Glaciecola sp.]|jgi:hypothetical protein
MFYSFPVPFADEHVASIIYRAFQCTNYKSIERYYKIELKELFFDMPQRFWLSSYLDVAMAFEHYYELPEFLLRSTNICDYTLLLYTEQNNIQSPLSLLEYLSTVKFAQAVSIKSDRAWRYCPECATEEDKVLGTSYWHVSHQSYYRLSCERHCCLLKSVKGKFGLPPVEQHSPKVTTKQIAVEKRLRWIVEQIRLTPAQHRTPNLIRALRQKLNIADAEHLTSQNRARLRYLHHWFAARFNETGLSEFFEWGAMGANLYPLDSQRGLYFMLNVKNNLHPMIYLMMCYTLLTDEEVSLALDVRYETTACRSVLLPTLMPENIPHASYS